MDKPEKLETLGTRNRTKTNKINNSKIKYQYRRKRQSRYPNIQIHDRSYFWLCTGIFNKT